MGDVAMTVPVIKNLLNQNPGVEVTVVSAKAFEPFFSNIERCNFFGASLKEEHKGLRGLYRLYRQIHSHCKSIDGIADLHNVIRSKTLCAFFKFSGKRIAKIDKGRADKKRLTQNEKKVLKQLPTTHERYANVFRKLGFTINLQKENSFKPREALPEKFISEVGINNSLIGIAPFAKHAEKTYPLERMATIVQLLNQQGNNKLLLFGGGQYEKELLEQWEKNFSGTYSVAGKYSLKEELQIISNLRLMVSMDSGNMHLASMYGVPVVSIWGATHPFAGFLGWAQGNGSVIQKELSCRPCSVFGNKPCFRGDLACMEIAPEKIIEKLVQSIQQTSA